MGTGSESTAPSPGNLCESSHNAQRRCLTEAGVGVDVPAVARRAMLLR